MYCICLQCHLRWQKGGDYLVVRVDRWATKSKKQLTYSLEVFHIRKPDIPVDTIEIKGQCSSACHAL